MMMTRLLVSEVGPITVLERTLRMTAVVTGVLEASREDSGRVEPSLQN